MPENACIAVRINAWRTIKLLAFRRTLTKNCWQKGCSMREIELEALLETASDAALVVDLDGVIFYANPSAEKLFASSLRELQGRFCFQVVQGIDQSRLEFCATECPVRQMARSGICPASFDLQMQTSLGRRWSHVTLLVAQHRAGTPPRYIIHLIHDMHGRVELEQAMRAFFERVASLTGPHGTLVSTSSPGLRPQLTSREQLTLDYLVRGYSTRHMAREMGLSLPTIRNHIQAILQKLAVHSRLQAVIRTVQDKRV
jgi:PAS domain S-box-containing protein